MSDGQEAAADPGAIGSRLGGAGDGLIFAVGMESTAIGVPVRGGGRRLDEYELTGHLDNWREDLRLAASTGAAAIRYGLPWYRVNPRPGRYDWTWADHAIGYLSEQTSLQVILDLVHYGTPVWLAGSFADPGYPEAVATYAEAVARRYAGAVAAYTPLNEPLVTASFCGLRGIWPPYLTGDQGWAAVIAAVAAGVQAATRAIRIADPDAKIVHVEAVQAYETADPSLTDEVRLWERRALLATDLILGELGPDDPMWDWLLTHGVSTTALEQLAAGAIRPEVLGLNYYPELSCRELVRLDGRAVHIARDRGSAGLEHVLRSWHSRYGRPLMVTETAVEGSDEKKCAWLDDIAASLGRLRADGVPVLGLTWWPVLDFVDWAWASGGTVVEEFYVRDRPDGLPRPVQPPGPPGGQPDDYLRRMGLFRLVAAEPGRFSRQPTALVARFREHAAGPLSHHEAVPTRRRTDLCTSSAGRRFPVPESAIAPRFPGGGVITFETRDVAEPGPGELLIKVAANALCGTDRAQYFEGSAVTPGHEAAGVVARPGPDCTVTAGTPGVVFLMDYCGQCRSCRAGFTNQCLAKRADMGFNRDGGYGPYELVHETNFFPIGQDMDLAEATLLLDVMGTSGHAIGRARLIRPDIESAYIAGAGPIGLGLLVMCKITFGQDFPVRISDVSQWRLDYAESFGAQPADARDEAVLRALPASDIAFDSTGKLAARKTAIQALGKRGVLVCVGHGETLELSVSADLIAPERAVLGSEYFRYDEMAGNLELLHAHRQLLSRVITHRFDVADIADAFRTFLSGESGKVVVTQPVAS